jgi:zinc transport system permease protein
MGIETLLVMLSYDFVQRALLVGLLLGMSTAVLGVFLILRRYSLIGDGLAHVSLLTTALAMLLGVLPLLLTIPLVIVAAFAIQYLSQRVKIHGEAAIGVISSLSIALAVLLVSINAGFNVDLLSYLFGSILLISGLDVHLVVVLSLVVALALLVFRRDLVSMAFDEDFARVRGVRVQRANGVLMVLTAISIAIGMRVVGSMLVSSLILLPGLAALQLAGSFKGALWWAVLFSVSAIVGGILLSFMLNWPSGATIVILNGLFLLLTLLFRRLRGQG